MKRLFACILLTAGVASAAEAPDFQATTLQGDAVQLSSYRGQIVVLDFWATWCPPCRAQLERLAALEKEMPEVVVLAVNVDSRRDRVEKYVRRTAVPRRVVMDPTGAIAARYAPQAMPWSVLVDAQGRVVSSGELDEAQLAALVRRQSQAD